MSHNGLQELKQKRCVPCEGGVPPVSAEEAARLLKELPGWSLSEDGKSIHKKWVVKNFVAGMQFLQKVADLAEQEQHHPDLHLTGYKNIQIELSTHAIGGLSENDFIVAAKINDISVDVKKS